MKRYINTAILRQDSLVTGNAGEGVPIRVFIAGSVTVEASLFSDVDGATPIVQPFNSQAIGGDMPGQFTFYSAGGLFDIYFNFGTGSETSIKNQLILNEVNASDFGVLADSDGTTGNGNDDTTAWQAAIDYAKTNKIKLTGPTGRSRITSALAISQITVEFNGSFVKDFDGVGIEVLEGGAKYTTLDNITIIGVGTQSTGSHGISVRDSRIKVIKGISKSNGGAGYYHLDDDGNNNHCELELRCENNTGHGVHIDIGAEGDDANNWKVDFQMFGNGGDGLRVEAICKDWVGRVRSEDCTGTGLNLIDGRRMDLNVYLETNTANDYFIADQCQFISLTGRLGSGNVNNNLTYRLKSGGNDIQVRKTTATIEKIVGTNMTSSASNIMLREYVGSSSETFAKERYKANGDVNIESIDRSDSVTIVALMGLDASEGAFQYGNGTEIVRNYVGSGSPEGVISANPGSTYISVVGGAGRTDYIKETGTGDTGWVPQGLRFKTSVQLADIADEINTTDKSRSRLVVNTTTEETLRATGSATNSTWVTMAGVVSITPS